MMSWKPWTRIWDDVVADLYGDDEEAAEDEEEGEDLYEVTCPNCGAVSTVDEETLLDQESELVCPNCGAAFDIELEGHRGGDPGRRDRQTGSVNTVPKPFAPAAKGFCVERGNFVLEVLRVVLPLAAALCFVWGGLALCGGDPVSRHHNGNRNPADPPWRPGTVAPRTALPGGGGSRSAAVCSLGLWQRPLRHPARCSGCPVLRQHRRPALPGPGAVRLRSRGRPSRNSI